MFWAEDDLVRAQRSCQCLDGSAFEPLSSGRESSSIAIEKQRVLRRYCSFDFIKRLDWLDFLCHLVVIVFRFWRAVVLWRWAR